MFGLKTWGNNKHQLVPASKPTKFMINTRAIGNELRRRCDKPHQHQPLVDGRAKDAARYPPALCKAICRGSMKEKMQRQFGIRGVTEVGEGLHKRRIDTEEFHDNDNVEVERFIPRRVEEVDDQMSQRDPTAGPTGTATR